MACNNSVIPPGLDGHLVAAASNTTPWASAEKLLEASIPGFSIISAVSKAYFHFDFSTLIVYLIPVAAVVAVSKYLYEPVLHYFYHYFVSRAEIRNDDEMYNYLMYWMSQQNFAANTLSFVAGTSTNSELFYTFDESDEEDKIKDNDVDWALAERDFDEYWAQTTRQDRVRPLYYTPAEGTHYFRHRGRYFELARTSSEKIIGRHATKTETLYVSCLGRDTQPVKELLREAQSNYIRRDGSNTVIYSKAPDYDGWWRFMSRIPRPLETVVLDSAQKTAIVEDIKEYLHPLTKRWYANRGIPYRRGYLLHGPPGTGKTSLCLALAGIFALKVHVLSLNAKSLTEEGLATLFAFLPPRCIVLLEDVDSAGITHKRGKDADNANSATDDKSKDKDKDKDKEDTDDKDDNDGNKSGISLSALLNVIDGVASSEGRILIMTTNHAEKLDAALLRPGRVDMSIRFENATTTVAEELFKSTYVSHTKDFPEVANAQTIFAKRSTRFSDGDVSKLARTFAAQVPSGEFSPAAIQGYLLKHKATPDRAVESFQAWVEKTREEQRQLQEAKLKKATDKKVDINAAVSKSSEIPKSSESAADDVAPLPPPTPPRSPQPAS